MGAPAQLKTLQLADGWPRLPSETDDNIARPAHGDISVISLEGSTMCFNELEPGRLEAK